ncbi:MAG: hypothetical protein DMG21_16965 [Acidobacteria bacterium]|nr:MAG: hypothetical protein DMG21_16965 [Acidobacteriota bacterium]
MAGAIALDMARMNATPASLSFGSEVANTTSAPQTVTVSNPGTAPLTFSAITPSNSFTVASGGTCSTSAPVPVKASCTVKVAFAPTMGGATTGTLTLTDNGIGSPHTVALSGTGEDFTLTTNQQSATVKVGGTATFTLSIAPESGFNQAVSFGCAGLPAHTTCAASPASITPSSTSASTATVTITTTAPSELGPQSRQRPLGPPGPLPWAHRYAPLQMLWPLALAVLAVAASCVSPLRSISARRSSPPQLNRVALALTLLLVLAWAGCGGTEPIRLAGTPPGNYSLTLTAASGNLSHSTTVKLTVNP